MNREVVERVRRAIFDTFASQGHPPSRQQVRDLAAVDEAQVNEAVPSWQLNVTSRWISPATS